MTEQISQVLRALRERLGGLYGQRLCGLYLYGSVARGEEDAESDIDVLVVLDRVDDYYGEIVRTSAILSELSLACGRSISCVFVSVPRWRDGNSMFLLNVREEAIPA